MKKSLAVLSLGLGLSLISPDLLQANDLVLRPIEVNNQRQQNLGLDEQLWGKANQPGDRYKLVKAIDHSLAFLQTNKARQAYQDYPIPGVSRSKVIRSLRRFRQLLIQARSPQELQTAVQKEFVWYRSVGKDNQGTVSFTGYFEAVYPASLIPTSEYRYPLYRQPEDFKNWQQPHPKRLELEGENGLLGKNSPLSGYELVWLKNRLDAFLVQVQGSARLELTNGKIMTVGYDGGTSYPYVSIGGELIKDGIFQPNELTLPALINYFEANPEQLDNYLPRNNRFVFFRSTNGALPQGSIGVPVTPDRSIATDKSIMPAGALALIKTFIPYPNDLGELEKRQVSRYVLDQDTGSAIKGAGRVDIFLGTGKLAQERAGLVNDTGELYYLLLKE